MNDVWYMLLGLAAAMCVAGLYLTRKPPQEK
jgi:LPXTG-motif cell wall-anchored protein